MSFMCMSVETKDAKVLVPAIQQTPAKAFNSKEPFFMRE